MSVLTLDRDIDVYTGRLRECDVLRPSVRERVEVPVSWVMRVSFSCSCLSGSGVAEVRFPTKPLSPLSEEGREGVGTLRPCTTTGKNTSLVLSLSNTLNGFRCVDPPPSFIPLCVELNGTSGSNVGNRTTLLIVSNKSKSFHEVKSVVQVTVVLRLEKGT